MFQTRARSKYCWVLYICIKINDLFPSQFHVTEWIQLGSQGEVRSLLTGTLVETIGLQGDTAIRPPIPLLILTKLLRMKQIPNAIHLKSANTGSMETASTAIAVGTCIPGFRPLPFLYSLSSINTRRCAFSPFLMCSVSVVSFYTISFRSTTKTLN